MNQKQMFHSLTKLIIILYPVLTLQHGRQAYDDDQVLIYLCILLKR